MLGGTRASGTEVKANNPSLVLGLAPYPEGKGRLLEIEVVLESQVVFYKQLHKCTILHFLIRVSELRHSKTI